MKLNPSDITEVAMPFMQQTHLQEVAMLNALYALFERLDAGEEVPELAAKLELLAEHTHAHFAREEEQMLAMHFPPYPVHKQAHDEYLDSFDGVLDEWRKHDDVLPVIEFLQNSTPGWMQQHIATMDFVTANFFAMRETSSPEAEN